MNQIIIQNLKIFAYHGVHESEKLNGQNFYIDLCCHTSKTRGYYSDNINDTVSYSEIIKVVKKSMLSKSHDLLEALSENISKDIFKNFSDIFKIELTLKKPEAPINETFDYVAIKTIRTRGDFNDG